jgi:signal transduction histidine kinase
VAAPASNVFEINTAIRMAPGKEQMDQSDIDDIRVLLIEDDEDDYVLLSNLLTEVPAARYKITWTQTYEEGLRELEKGDYDVCLLDYLLGVRNGLEILSTLAESPKRPPIIVLTGQGDYHVDLKAMEYGAADYLIKVEMTGHALERAIRYAMERKRSKDALRESERQLKRLSSALLKVQENERRMLAAELHDNLGQLLTAIKFNIEGVLARMDPGESSTRDLNALIPNIQAAVEQVRNMYTGLMPTALDDLGILATLSWFCREFQKDHPTIRLERKLDANERDISADLRLVIFRIAQDALKNVAAHSGADSASISLSSENGSIRLDIGDNGTGFDVSRVMSTACSNCGLGLMSMKRRAELSGGSFQIDSCEGEGTSIRVRWPVNAVVQGDDWM